MNRRPLASYALILLNVIVFVWQLLTHGLDSEAELQAHGALNGSLVMQGQWWRIFSGAFEHGGYLHIALNMFALLQVGSFVEMVAGRWRMLAIYFIALVGSGLAVTYFAPNTDTVGASGAIFGLFGALVAIGIRLGKAGRSLITQTLPIIGINLFLTFTIPQISIAAHVGGLISGFASGLAIFMMQRRGTVVAEQSEADELSIHPEEALVRATAAPEAGEDLAHEAGDVHEVTEEGSR